MIVRQTWRRSIIAAAPMVAVVIVALCAGPIAARQARDARTVSAGSASISGVVVAEDTGQPAQRVRVDVAEEASTNGSYRTAITDDQGHFSFSLLPAGEFTLTASKTGY